MGRKRRWPKRVRSLAGQVMSPFRREADTYSENTPVVIMSAAELRALDASTRELRALAEALRDTFTCEREGHTDDPCDGECWRCTADRILGRIARPPTGRRHAR